MVRKIIHLDMDAFFAAIEIRDKPALAQLPIAIGGGDRGVIATCNYRARSFGVRSAMPTRTAKKLCPALKFIKPNFSKYKQASLEVMSILENYTPLIEPVSIDEAYLDVTDSTFCQNSATLLATKIRAEILKETGLTASAGIAPNKLLAKIASDYNKPNGQFTVAPHEVDAFIAQVPLQRIGGVGRVLSEKLKNLGLITCQDLQVLDPYQLTQICGRFGHSLYSYCRGMDERPVQTEYERKSVGVERTFLKDLTDPEEMRTKLAELIDELHQDLTRFPERHIKNIHVKIKYNDFVSTTIERNLSLKDQSFFDLFAERYQENIRPVRLLGVGVKFFPSQVSELQQLALPLL